MVYFHLVINLLLVLAVESRHWEKQHNSNEHRSQDFYKVGNVGYEKQCRRKLQRFASILKEYETSKKLDPTVDIFQDTLSNLTHFLLWETEILL